MCSSEIVYDPNLCQPNWGCKTEPVICPPHGIQEKICVDVSHCNDSKEQINEITCSPGVCSGCFVPRAEGTNRLDNTCIPYGTRLEFDEGDKDRFYEYEMNREGDGYFNVNINSDNSFKIKVVKDYPDVVKLIVNDIIYNIKEGERFVGHSGDRYKIIIQEHSEVEKFDITIAKVHYSENVEDRYLVIKQNEEFNGYCDPFSGNIEKQRNKDYNGNWAKCQNNYECESNVCSSGECIDIAGTIKQAGRFKTLFLKIICRLSALFGDSTYNQCLADSLGISVPADSNIGNPPAIPD